MSLAPYVVSIVALLLGSTAWAAPPENWGRQVIAFQVNKSNWRSYHWDTLTTLVLYDGLDPAMLPVAAANGVTLAWPATFSTALLSANATAQEAWIREQVDRVVTTNTSGINVDYESPIARDSPLVAALASLMLRLGDSLRRAVIAAGRTPHYSIDVAWRAGGIDGRWYDYAALGAIFDLTVIMDYDTRSQVFLRDGAACTAGANAPRSTVVDGIASYLALGIPRSKLVLGTPWYGYDYPCTGGAVTSDPSVAGAECVIAEVPFRGCNCSDAAGRQHDLRILDAWLANSTSNQRRVSPIVVNGTTLAVTWNYVDAATNAVHQVWYDDASTLGAKYGIAAELGLAGVSMWNVDSIVPTTAAADTPASVTSSMRAVWSALRMYLRGQP